MGRTGHHCPFGVTSLIPFCNSITTRSEVKLKPLPVRDAFSGWQIFGAAGIDACDPEQFSPRAELTVVIGSRQPERLGQRLKAQPFRVEIGANWERDGHAESGIRTPAQVYARDGLRIDQKTLAGNEFLAGPQHAELQPLTEHRD